MEQQLSNEGGAFKGEGMNSFDVVFSQIQDSDVEDSREGITRQMSQRVQIEVESLQSVEAAESERLQFYDGAVDQ